MSVQESPWWPCFPGLAHPNIHLASMATLSQCTIVFSLPSLQCGFYPPVHCLKILRCHPIPDIMFIFKAGGRRKEGWFLNQTSKSIPPILRVFGYCVSLARTVAQGPLSAVNESGKCAFCLDILLPQTKLRFINKEGKNVHWVDNYSICWAIHEWGTVL